MEKYYSIANDFGCSVGAARRDTGRVRADVAEKCGLDQCPRFD